MLGGVGVLVVIATHMCLENPKCIQNPKQFPPHLLLNPYVLQENLNPYVPDLLSLSHLYVVGKSPLMSKKTYEQFLWPLRAFVLSRGKLCFACMGDSLIVTIRTFSKISKGEKKCES